jgi:hypothetical protein
MLEETTNSQDQNTKDKKSKIHDHLSNAFVIVGIISFTLGAIVNWYTIKRIKGGGV